MFILKEVFYQPAFEGVPSSWIVQYWENDPTDFPEAQYFKTLEDAEVFADTMWPSYEDWLGSQQTPLANQ